MNYLDLYSSYPDHTIAAAWDSQVKEADKTPWLADTLTDCGDELFARFAACYAELRALPRSARRALQRQLARSSELAAILPEYLQHGGRRLQHRMAWSLAGAALLLTLSQGVAPAATITVSTNNPNIASDGQCSLIEALVNANNDAATHADCAAGSGADTIVLPANANVTLSNVYVTVYGNSPVGLPLITSRITIEGNGATIARQGNAPDFRLMFVRGNFPLPSTPGDLTLQNVTLSGGSGSSGVHNSGTLSIENSIISGNTSGGVSNGGTLTIENSIISGNTTNFNGGGVLNGGTLTIENSTIANNRSNGANFGGGGLYNDGGTTIINSTISGNTAGFGGGVYNNWYGTLTIENSTISGNSGSSGGGLFNSAGSLTLTNSTISGNIGGGLINSFGLINRFYCYYHCSRGGNLTLNRSLIAGNQAPVAPEIQNISTVGYVSVVNANNFNLFGTNGNAGVSGFTPGPTDIVPGVSVAQILGPLKFNGGPTQTHALKPSSPALDVVPLLDPSCTGTDQRGIARPQGTACDIGAVEGAAPGSIPVSDFDGDGETDVAVYQTSTGNWFVVGSTSGFFSPALSFGGADFLPVPGDYDGDGAADTAVYQTSTGNWFVVGSTSGFFSPALNFGGPGFIPVPGDYDGDGETDVAVYQTSTGNWFVVGSTAGFFIPGLNFGGSGFIPVPGDYDGDGETDVAVYQQNTGNWFAVGSSSGFFIPALNFGGTGFMPVPGDYDGDGKIDAAVYQSSSGNWFAVGSTFGFFSPALNFGGSGFTPVQGDYDGDGEADVAVYQTSTGNWFVVGSTAGFFIPALNFGSPEYVPVLPQVTILRAFGLL